jgi:signal transduction histidine kinase
MAAGGEDPAEIPRLLAETAVESLGASAAGVVEIDDRGEAVLSASKNLPAELAGWRIETERIGSELGEELLRATDAAFSRVRTYPLSSGGDLFGALVVLFVPGAGEDEGTVRLEAALADVAAVVFSNTRRIAQLDRALREVRASRDLLARNEKLRTLGQMAAGVAHDVKNLLNPLALQTQLLRRHEKKSAKDLEALVGAIDVTVKSGIEIAERLRAFSRQAPEGLAEPADVDGLVREAVRLCLPRLPIGERPVHLRQKLGGPPPTRVHAAELVSSIVNLVLNAVEAMPGGGDIEVSTGVEHEIAFVRVADTGPGMPPEVEARAFEPFFTTKGDSGTGLGLAMVYAFVKRYGGKVDLETAPGRGTTFTMRFPID